MAEKEGVRHTPAPPRATSEPGATVARCQPHLPTTSHQTNPTQKRPQFNFFFFFKANVILSGRRCF